MTGETEQRLAADVARALVAELAPEELPLFRATSGQYFARLRASPEPIARSGDLLGFGAGEAVSFLTPVALAAATEAITFLLAEAKKDLASRAVDIVGEWIDIVFRLPPKTPPQEPVPPPRQKDGGSYVVTLTHEQIVEVRERVHRTARRLGLTEPRAALMADSFIGSLVLAT